jgi:hypothetical protein
MQKVEGSSPFSRFEKSPANHGVFSFHDRRQWHRRGAGTTRGYQIGIASARFEDNRDAMNVITRNER